MSELEEINQRIAVLLNAQNSLSSKVHIMNELRKAIHENGPFANEPVDYVKWVASDDVVANDYNPNKVAPPEMELLELSITNDGYTQPIVTWSNPEKQKTEVIDGFHRNRVGKESSVVRERIQGYLPVVDIRQEQSSKKDRIASTIRHNRARGKHQIDAMSEIVIELKNRNWANSRIARELGMDEEEVLRLCQISGLEAMFSDHDFSRAWEASDTQEDDWVPITDELPEEFIDQVRATNTNDDSRIFHTFDKWECHKAGFYASSVDGRDKDECEELYAEFLRDTYRFQKSAESVIREWRHSCEHYLTNRSMNRIAWIGQASMCYATGIPSKYCAGFNLMSEVEQDAANDIALTALNEWLAENGRPEVSMDEAMGGVGRQVEIY